MLLACSGAMHQDSALIDRLKNRGPVTLSTDNPFLAANLLLSRELAASPELAGFIQHRGTPAGMAVEKQLFGSLILHFYYLDKPEHYTLEETQGLWIIGAPQPLHPEEERALRQIDQPVEAATHTTNQTSAALLTPTIVVTIRPTLIATSTSSPVNPTPAVAPTEHVIASIAANTPLPTQPPVAERGFKSLPLATTPVEMAITPLPTRAATRPPIVRSTATPFPRPTTSISSSTHESAANNADKLETATVTKEGALVESIKAKVPTEQAEITPRGDLVHYITSEAESLDAISLWYTLDRTNAGRVARVNNLGERTRLNVGDTVVIPAYLLRNKARLSEGALSALKQVLPAAAPPVQVPAVQTNAAIVPKSLGSEAALERDKRK